jgi:hypothetical protein
MTTTVKELINYLKTERPNAVVVYQYLLAEHTSLSPKEFAQAAEQLEDTRFADEIGGAMKDWIEEVADA